jgi:hypothetical protein
MLCNEYRVPSHRRLLVIIFRKRRRQSGLDEMDGVGTDGVDALGLDVSEVPDCQIEAGAEFGFFQGGEGFGDLAGHMGSVFGAGVPCAIGNIVNDNLMFSDG